MLRIGRQPYGVLPVTSLDGWTDPEGVSTRSVTCWCGCATRSGVRPPSRRPRVGRTDDASVDLATVLEAGGLSSSYRVRNLMGQHFLQHLRAFLGEDLAVRSSGPTSWS